MHSYLQPEIKRDLFLVVLVLILSGNVGVIISDFNGDMLVGLKKFLAFSGFAIVLATVAAMLFAFLIGALVYLVVMVRFGDGGEVIMRLYLNYSLNTGIGFLSMFGVMFYLCKYYGNSFLTDAYMYLWVALAMLIEIVKYCRIGGLLSVYLPDSVVSIVEQNEKSVSVRFVGSKREGPYVWDKNFYHAIRILENNSWRVILIEKDGDVHVANLKYDIKSLK